MSGSRTRVAVGVALLGLALSVAAGAYLGRARGRAAPDLTRWGALIDTSAREFDLDAHLLRGLVAVESSGEPGAVSPAGAVGLLQLMPATAREQAERLRVEDFSEDRLTEPALNVRLGASYLARLLARFDGEEAFALAAYNAGATRVKRWRERAPDASAREVIRREGFAETRGHVERVLRFREIYRKRAAGRD